MIYFDATAGGGEGGGEGMVEKKEKSATDSPSQFTISLLR